MYGTKLHWNWGFFLAPSTPAASHISTTITSFSPPDYSRISHIKRAFSAPIIFRKAYSSPTPKNEDTILLQMFSLPTNILPKSPKTSPKDSCILVPSHTLIFQPYEFLQMAFSSMANLHAHFSIKALLTKERFLTPKPPTPYSNTQCCNLPSAYSFPSYHLPEKIPLDLLQSCFWKPKE